MADDWVTLIGPLVGLTAMGTLIWTHLCRRRRGTTHEVECILLAAGREAMAQGWSRVLPEHYLVIALLDERLVASLRETGCDATALQQELRAQLAKRRPKLLPRPTRHYRVSSELRRTFVRAAAFARRELLPVFALEHVVRAMADDEGSALAELLQGVSPDVAALSHRAALPVRELAGPTYRVGSVEALSTVVLWNDHQSPMPLVLAILEEVFAKGPGEAMYLMLRVHFDDAAVIGEFTTVEATARVEEATRRARAAGKPLKVTVEAPHYRHEPEGSRWRQRAPIPFRLAR